MQYLVLIHRNTDTPPTSGEWKQFFESAAATGIFKGGSAIGTRYSIGDKTVPDTTQHVGGFMRFDSADLDRLTEFLDNHPVVKHGGTLELLEMPET